MGGEFGVENFNKVVDLPIEVGNIFGKMYEDGELTKEDAVHVTELADEMFALFGVKYTEIPKELGELDAEDREAIQTHIAQKFDIPQDQIESITEKYVKAAFLLIEAGYLIYEASKEVKAYKESKDAEELTE